MSKKEETKAIIFFVFIVGLVFFLAVYSLSFWDGKLGMEDNGDGRYETLYLYNPLNEINPSAGDYYSE
ncbi:MAG: hypothetical protein JKY93_12425 [Gammaproteobacteria bacterium]|nr:hypothetical protein [Gammaproteobacteria bacterium]